MQPKLPPEVRHLFAEARAALLALLASLTPAAWDAPTVCAGWSAKDLAAHLLGDDLAILSAGRDGYERGWFRVAGWEELVARINRRNEEWVAAHRALSPALLLDLLTFSGERVEAYFTALDPAAPGPVVSWAGPEPASTGLHLAREYTERWLHQEQIRDAVGAPGLRAPRLFHPVLDAFIHALPHTYRDVPAAEGTHLRLVVTGPAGGAWSLLHCDGGWNLYTGVTPEPVTTITVDEDTAWRLFTKGIGREAARDRMRCDGDPALCEPFLSTVAIIA